jgi:pimeloyl-ACP methyl ester carboxylesterase
LGLVSALGYRSVAAVVGHDWGSPVAAYCGVLRPDVFRSVALMSVPFAGPPPLPFNTAEGGTPGPSADVVRDKVYEDLAKLDPPRKDYQQYYRTREANDNMWKAPQGIHAFLRAYYHFKSADWKQNKPFKLASFTAGELAKMPTYYIMDLDKGMAETVAPEMPSAAEIAGCKWLPDKELAVYATEWDRTGFQGGLQWYRCTTGKYTAELETLSGRTIDVRPVSSPVRATGLSTTRPVRLRECKPLSVPDGMARTWSRTPDIGWGRSSRSKWEDCF